MAIGCGRAAGAQAKPVDTHPILRSVFEATGLDAREQAFFEARFDALARKVAAYAGTSGAPAHRAQRLHRYLHHRVLKTYRDDADGLDAVLGRNEFNCVSSTVLEGLLATSLGLSVEIVSGTNHVALRLALPARTVDIETTIPDGFDPRGRAEASARFLIADGLADPGAIGTRTSRDADPGHPPLGHAVPLASAPAFVWHNMAARALARGEGLAAAALLFEAERRYPGVASAREGIQFELGQAFRADDDAGRLDDAYATAVLGVRLDPDDVAAHGRLITVAARRIDDLAARGEPGRAEAVLLEVDALLGDSARRFDREVLPEIAASAARAGDFDQAECLAGRLGSTRR